MLRYTNLSDKQVYKGGTKKLERQSIEGDATKQYCFSTMMSMLEIFWLALIMVVLQRLLDKCLQVLLILCQRLVCHDQSAVIRHITPEMQSTEQVPPQTTVERKIYAVKQGFLPGLYNSWVECERQVKGYRGAEYKSFQSLSEAEMYLQGT